VQIEGTLSRPAVNIARFLAGSWRLAGKVSDD
jgi:hypothetical protein